MLVIMKGQEYFLQSILGNLSNNNNGELEDIKIIVLLKNLSNFIFSLNFLMINTELTLN